MRWIADRDHLIDGADLLPDDLDPDVNSGGFCYRMPDSPTAYDQALDSLTKEPLEH
ncbi:hypothetical protein [Microvirga sp. VF16]|uniref:hypothetical protein n=1 Tax=Microvirga sp. VF16 TaxID=2807101 RepID=UPI00193CC966|nr:hypothetical protein [Microvirga sp. VF16]QRM35556.1 hypothetical protein JO965_45335 [Microvirga sp. VF16]